MKKTFDRLMQQSRKAFTLIEILIVIAIIGILTVALLPRIQGAQSSARNTARKADLNQIATALAAYNGDAGRYPENLDELAWSNSYLKSLPKDPANKAVCGEANGEAWYYYARKGDGYILAAYMEKQPWNPNVNYEGECGDAMAPKVDKVETWTDKAKYVIKVDN
jgi:prepilin-type N-terminal cleavage/methylation domain-containing protein